MIDLFGLTKEQGFFACINQNRRLAKDIEATIKSAQAFLYAASAVILLRRLAC